MAEIVPCPLCGSFELKPVAMRFRVGYPHISRVQCLKCRVFFANPMASEDELRTFYGRYYDKGNFGEDNAKARCKDTYRKLSEASAGELSAELERFRAYYWTEAGRGRRFLDVGCGLGRAVFLATLLGYEAVGTEVDDDAAAFCRTSIPGAEFRGGGLIEQDFASASFDYVLLYHVIEHLRDPGVYLTEIHRLLRPGGRLFIGTPNPDALAYRIYHRATLVSGRIPSIVDGLEHTIVFPVRTLKAYVRSFGFDILHSRTEAHTESLQRILFGEGSIVKRGIRLAQRLVPINQVLVVTRRPDNVSG